MSENLQHSDTEGWGTRGEGVGVWGVSDERRECYSKREVRQREVGSTPKIGSKMTEGGCIGGLYIRGAYLGWSFRGVELSIWIMIQMRYIVMILYWLVIKRIGFDISDLCLYCLVMTN